MPNVITALAWSASTGRYCITRARVMARQSNPDENMQISIPARDLPAEAHFIGTMRLASRSRVAQNSVFSWRGT